MTFRELLDFHLINSEKISITVSHVLIVFIILASAWLLLRIIRRIFHRAEARQKMDVGTSRAIFQIIKYILWIIAISLALDTVGIKITFLIASSAALLVGLGLGLQQIFQDFIFNFDVSENPVMESRLAGRHPESNGEGLLMGSR